MNHRTSVILDDIIGTVFVLVILAVCAFGVRTCKHAVDDVIEEQAAHAGGGVSPR